LPFPLPISFKDHCMCRACAFIMCACMRGAEGEPSEEKKNKKTKILEHATPSEERPSALHDVRVLPVHVVVVATRISTRNTKKVRLHLHLSSIFTLNFILSWRPGGQRRDPHPHTYTSFPVRCHEPCVRLIPENRSSECSRALCLTSVVVCVSRCQTRGLPE